MKIQMVNEVLNIESYSMEIVRVRDGKRVRVRMDGPWSENHPSWFFSGNMSCSCNRRAYFLDEPYSLESSRCGEGEDEYKVRCVADVPVTGRLVLYQDEGFVHGD